MKTIQLTATLDVYDSIDELEPTARELMLQAVAARKDAYAPYSGFQVGCAISLRNGKVVIGNNQENAAYPSGLCAERVAIFSAGATYPGVEIKAIAITAGPKQAEFNKPVPPCGACRQSMAEYENNQNTPIPIYFMGTTGKVMRADSIIDLLPLVFDKAYL